MVSLVRRMSSLDSMGINSLALNARAYGVSSIGCFRVIRYAYSAMGSSPTHFPLVDVSLFFK